ncbi:30S ribosomal protein THX [Peijinzhouia sedimentorum]
MARGDRKSKKGKIWSGSYGVTRPHKKKKSAPESTEPKAEKKATTKKK